MAVVVGGPAPDFELRDQHGQPVRLWSYRGGAAVLLVFFPFAFTPTCTGELRALDVGGLGDVTERVQVLGVSCDPSPGLRVFGEQHGIEYPLLSDFWPHGDVSRKYGAFLEDRGFATRATFLIDEAGVVRWCVVTSPAQARSTDDYREALRALARDGHGRR